MYVQIHSRERQAEAISLCCLGWHTLGELALPVAYPIIQEILVVPLLTDRHSHPKPCMRGEMTRWLLSWFIRMRGWSPLSLQRLLSQGSDSSEKYQEEGNVGSFQSDNLLSESKPPPPGSIPRHLTCSLPYFLRTVHHLCLPPPIAYSSQTLWVLDKGCLFSTPSATPAMTPLFFISKTMLSCHQTSIY